MAKNRTSQRLGCSADSLILQDLARGLISGLIAMLTLVLCWALPCFKGSLKTDDLLNLKLCSNIEKAIHIDFGLWVLLK